MRPPLDMHDISQPEADLEFDFEWYQGGVHVWVGGDMRSPATAGYDPIFYMHHAFVDYIWELFRRHQFRDCGLDPVTNYPATATGGHAPDAKMTGFEWLTIMDGLKAYWLKDWYKYKSTPACPDCCPGCTFPAPIYCNTVRRQNICVARSRRQFSVDTSKKAYSRASLDPAEIDAIANPPPPRNRGVAYRHSPSDGRSIHTAISDAFTAMSETEQMSAAEPPRRRIRPERRTLGGQSIDMTRRVDGPGVPLPSGGDRRRLAAANTFREPISPGLRFPPTTRGVEFVEPTRPPPTRRGRFDSPRSDLSDLRALPDTRRFPEPRNSIPISNRLSISDTRRPLPDRRVFPERRRGIISNTLETSPSDRRMFAQFSDRDRISGRRLPDRRSMTSRRRPGDVIPF